MNAIKNVFLDEFGEVTAKRVFKVIFGVLFAPVLLYFYAFFWLFQWLIKRVWVPFYREMKPLAVLIGIIGFMGVLAVLLNIKDGNLSASTLIFWPLCLLWDLLISYTSNAIGFSIFAYFLVGIVFVLIFSNKEV